MFIENKYAVWYKELIANAQKRVGDCDTYYERHHILPKSLGGKNTKDNLVNLTAKEHFIAHALLVRMVSGDSKRKMAYAFNCMALINGVEQSNRKISSRLFEYNKKIISDLGPSEETKEKMRGPRPQSRGPRSHVDQKGTKNNAYKGQMYITPWGSFPSVRAAVEACSVKINADSIHRLCKKNKISFKLIQDGPTKRLNIPKGIKPVDLGFYYVGGGSK